MLLAGDRSGRFPHGSGFWLGQVNSCFLDNVLSRVLEPPWRLFLGDGNAFNYVARKGRVLLRVAPSETVDDVHAADDLAENRLVTLR